MPLFFCCLFRRWSVVWMHRGECANWRRWLQIDQEAGIRQPVDLQLSWRLLPIPGFDPPLPAQWHLETSTQKISASEMQEWVMWRRCFSLCFKLPALYDNWDPFALQLLNAQTPMCWRMETSRLLRRGTLWTMRPRMSATLDTHCEAHLHVFACQTGSGAAPLPSVATTVSPEQKPTFFLPLLSLLD